MSEVIVYGASDDLIEVDGAIIDEFDVPGEGTVLIITPGGGVIEVRCELGGDWSAAASLRRNDTDYLLTTETVDRPGFEGENGDMAIKITSREEGKWYAYLLDESVQNFRAGR